jgi:hypothetical protein
MTIISGWATEIMKEQLNNSKLVEYLFVLVALGILFIATKNFFKAPYIYSIVSDPLKFPDDQNEKVTANGWIQKLKNKLVSSRGMKTEWIQGIEKKKQELNQVKYFDMLTKLPNRVKLMKDFQQRLSLHTTRVATWK